ncbi:MAG: alkaline phosphatase [Thermotogota bacterium]|nr:alkaline phosphatase [Thermotogota bacterium]MDK2864857.1 alkaline phosphatase [Thermotogota bacterium]HCZ06110.1 alkaline phosphatase [Thermotogota bacterium]
MRKVLLLLLALVLVAAVAFGFVKNVIYMIGDGMSFNNLVLASYLEGKRLTLLNTPYTGWVLTHSADSIVTDSAAAGTALLSGFKTNNGMIGMLPDGTVVPSIAEIAAKNGVKVGIVVTCRVTHATPGAVYGHVESRNDENTLAEQLVNSDITVVFGGGWRHFVATGGKRTDGKDLIALAKAKGFDYITTRTEMLNYHGDKVLGLFSSSHLAPASERSGEQPMLWEMVDKALEVLSKDGAPFFLMVEGSQIDWENHGNDVYGMWQEVLEFNKAFEVALEFAESHPDTLIVVTSDHETGGLGLSTGGYTMDIELLRGYKKNADWLARESGGDIEKLKSLVKEYCGVELTDEDVSFIEAMKAANPSYGYSNAIGRILSNKAKVGWTTFDHTAGPVPIFAVGPGAEHFVGVFDNTDIPRIIGRLAGYPLVYPTIEVPVQ